MGNKPLVSICIPVYNGEKYLDDCIKSVLNQTYKNLEYIIVDNASSDNTPLIIDKYKKNDSRIKSFRNEKTVGMEDNFNLCASHITESAKWIKYALVDDYLFPDCVEKMVNVGELDDQIGIISAYRMTGKTVTNLGLPIDQNVFNGADILKQQILRKLHVASSSPNTVMYRKKFFNEMNGFNNKYDHSDTELAFRLLDKYKLGFVHHVITKSGRETGGGEYHSIIHGIKLLEYLDFGYKKINNYKSISFEKRELDELRIYYAKNIVDFIVTKCAYFEWEDINRMMHNTPGDIKKKLKKIFVQDIMKYIRKYLNSLIHIRSYRAEKKRCE